MLSSLFSRQVSALGHVAATGVGPVSVSGLTPDSDPYAGMASGMAGYVPAGSSVLAIYVGGDAQSVSGIGPVGWVSPA